MKSRIEESRCGNRSAFALASGAAQTALLAAGQQTATIAGTAKDEAKKPYADYSVRARDVRQGRSPARRRSTPTATLRLPDLSSSRVHGRVGADKNNGQSGLHRGTVRLDAADAQERRRHRLRQSAGGLVAARRSGSSGYHGRCRRGQRQPLAIAVTPRRFEVSTSARSTSTAGSDCLGFGRNFFPSFRFNR